MGRTSIRVLALMASLTGVHCGNGNVSPADGATDARADQSTLTDGVSADSSQRCTSDLDCSDHTFCNGVELCMPGASGANAQGCIPPSIPTPCRADQVCDEAAQRCTTQCAVEGDADGDGVLSAACGGGDCDDHDRNRFPGNREYCDPTAPDHDEDCDAETYGVRDHDMDGAGSSACCNVASDGTRHCGTDCDDSNASAHPGLSETCDGIDNNCDGDANVHPGQTSYFTLPRSDRSVGAPDAYDYDCNGTSDIQYATVTRCYSFGGSCGCMTASLGWSTTTPPPCGMTQQTADCLPCDSGCNPHTAGNTQTQGCR